MRRLTARGSRCSVATLAIATAAVGAALLGGCASAGSPPGGPERHTPPALIGISIDSGATNVVVKELEFKFDEVVSDRPSGTATDLSQLFLVSPRDGDANVGWHRDRITVRPRKGFRANTAYRITMLPGVADLRGNIRKEGVTVLFSTGGSIPPFSIPGRVFDWEAQRPASGAYIEAVALRDTTLVYITATDSSGQFDVGPLDAGTYRVRALIDQNANRALDRNEKWDSTTVALTTTRQAIELDAIERDSVPPAFGEITRVDSVTLRVRFDKALDPATPITASMVRLTRADSTPLAIASVQTGSAFDRAASVADSIRRVAADTGAARRPVPAAPPPPAGVPVPGGQRAAPPPPKPRALPPEKSIVITVAPTNLLNPGRYVLHGMGFRNLVGNTTQTKGELSEVRRVFVISPPPPPRDTTKKAPGDTTRRSPADTARRRPPPLERATRQAPVAVHTPVGIDAPTELAHWLLRDSPRE